MLGDQLVKMHPIDLRASCCLGNVAARRFEHRLQIFLFKRINQLLLGGLKRHRQIDVDRF